MFTVPKKSCFYFFLYLRMLFKIKMVNSIKNTYRFVALFLALLMLVTSMVFVIDMHFCRGHLQSLSFFGKAKTCQQMSHSMRMKKCPHYKRKIERTGKCAVNEKDNCENKTLRFQFDQDQEILKLDFNVIKQFKQFIAAYLVVFFLDKFSIKNDLPSFAHYKSPLISRDIYVLFQSFLL